MDLHLSSVLPPDILRIEMHDGGGDGFACLSLSFVSKHCFAKKRSAELDCKGVNVFASDGELSQMPERP